MCIVVQTLLHPANHIIPILLLFFLAAAKKESMIFILLVLLTILTPKSCHTAAARSNARKPEESKDWQPSYTRGNGLYFDSSDVPALRAKANTTHRFIYEHLCKLSDRFKSRPETVLPPVDSKVFVSKWNEQYGNRLAVLAFYSVLQPNDHRVFDLLITFMDRMVDYPTWFVEPQPTDEVPVSHSLTGFATAFDFLKDRLTDQQKQRYALKIYEVTKNLYDRGQFKWWGCNYIQNHVASITMAVLNGAIVLQTYCKEEAPVWSEWAFEHLKKTLLLLDLVIDGSMNEGTAYGTYTTRSLTQFLYVAKRHYNVDLTNFWVKQHYDFLLGTTLPGYLKVIGIADSASSWFYGPESQLAFLDTFVLKNGEANWLISKIHSARRKSNRFGRYCTEHTEYLWYNPSIREQSPFLGERARSKLFRFTDAGIVTYGAGRESNETLLSFKSGPLHGRAVYVAMERKLFPWLVSWEKSLNPGHEHPDQNSFVFYPRGKPMITETLYGSKFTFLNNGLMFGPSPFAKHFPPFEGQLGESFKWLDWASKGMPHAWGEVVTAVEDKGMVLCSGEAVGAYHDHLRLKSVYRVLVLLSPDILLVMDHIELSPGSFLKYTNSYFNNIHYPFKVLDVKRPLNLGANAVLEGEDGEMYEIRWTSLPNDLLSANSGKYSQTVTDLNIDAEFLNLSISLGSSITRAAYVFSGPRAQVHSVGFSKVSDIGVRVSVRTEGGEYTIALVTEYSDVLARYQFLGTLGYGWVREPSGYVHTFAAKQVVVKSMDNSSESFNEPTIQEQLWTLQDEWTNYAIVLGSCSMNFLCIWAILSRFRRLKTKYVSAQTIAFYGFLLLLLLSLGALALAGSNYVQSYYNLQSTAHVHLQKKSPLPSVFVSTLGNYGSSLVAALFQNSTDFLYLSPSYPAPKMVDVAAAKSGIGCLDFTTAAFHSPEQISRLYATTSEKLKQLKRHQLLYPNAMTVLHTEEPRCCMNTPSLESVALDPCLKFIHIAVRDPTKWIANQMAQIAGIGDYRTHFKDLLSIVNCTNVSTSPPEYRQLLDYLNSDDNLPLHRLLALFWRANTAVSQRLAKQLHPLSYLHVHFEDIIDNPVETATKIYSFLGLPLPLSTEFHILQHTKSSINSHTSADTTWNSAKLTAEQIEDINAICLY